MSIVVFGLDGALVDRRRRLERVAAMREPGWCPEHDDFSHDTPNADVAALVRALHDAGHRIVLLSDRPARLASPTKAFLSEWGIPFHELFHRRDGDDERPQEAVELELFADAALPGANVLGVFHDNPAFLDALRRRGITCFEVCAEGLA